MLYCAVLYCAVLDFQTVFLHSSAMNTHANPLLRPLNADWQSFRCCSPSLVGRGFQPCSESWRLCYLPCPNPREWTFSFLSNFSKERPRVLRSPPHLFPVSLLEQSSHLCCPVPAFGFHPNDCSVTAVLDHAVTCVTPPPALWSHCLHPTHPSPLSLFIYFKTGSC